MASLLAQALDPADRAAWQLLRRRGRVTARAFVMAVAELPARNVRSCVGSALGVGAASSSLCVSLAA